MGQKTGFFLAVMVAAFLSGPAHAREDWLDQSRLCEYEIEKQERLQRIPQQLLKAVALTESGRWHKDSGRLVPWPWTVMAEGKGNYFNSMGEAVGFVMKLKSRGVKNIDVGCMQVNLMYHPEAFANLEEAFLPRTNVQYASTFLTRLKDDTRSWTQAVSKYHSNTPHYAQKYQKRVFNNWHSARRYAYEDRRAQILEKYRQQREARYNPQPQATPVQTASAESGNPDVSE